MINIIIDSGHNINTDGKRSFDETLREYEFNLDVSNKINNFISLYNDFDSYILTSQYKDVSDDVNYRIKNINNSNANLVLSIHANAYGTDWNSANGWECYCSDPTNTSLDSTKFAYILHKNSAFLELKDRGVKDSNGQIGVVDKVNKPSVLVEHGFFTNLEEVEKLKTQSFRMLCACVDMISICEFFGINKFTNEYYDLQETYGFSDATMLYLACYPYHNELYKKLLNKELLSWRTIKYILGYEYGEDLLAKVYG